MDYVRQLVSASDRDANWTAPLQQDSAEFLASLLQACEAECRDGEPTLQGFFESKVSQHFRCSNGCQSENHASVSYPFCLPIPAANSNSVEQSLGMIFRTEDGVHRNCDNCPGRLAQLTTRMQTFPEILILQLQRFQVGERGARKIVRDIRVPDVLVPDRDGPSYSLASGIVHSGSVYAGHYICIAKCPTSGRFFTVDDHRPVTEYDARTRKLDQSYLAVYQKMSEHGTPVRKKIRVAEDIDDSSAINERFEELISGLTSSELNTILEKFGIRRQNAVKRRMEDLRRHFLKHPEQQTDILTAMSEREANVSIDFPTSRGDGLPKDTPLPSSPTVHTSLHEDHESELRNESAASELPSPPYVPLNNSNTADQQTFDRDQGVNIDSLIEGVDGLSLSSILKKLNIKPQNALGRRRAQLKKYYMLSGSNQAVVIQALRDINNPNGKCLASDARAASLPDLTDDESEVESEDESDDELPTPPHVPLDQHRVAEQNSTDGCGEDISTWDRKTILNYINVHGIKCKLNTDAAQLRKVVARHYFNRLVSQVSATALAPLIERLNLKKQDKYVRQKAQLRSAYLKTLDPTILRYLVDNRTQAEAEVQQPSLPAYKNDFFPEDLEEIMKKRQEIKADREARIEGLNSGIFRLLNEDGTNRIIESGKEMHEELASYKMEDCNVCKERWFEMNIGVRSGKCQRCASERLDKNIPHTFSPENDMHPGLAPTCLSVLNSTEVAAISLICPQLTIFKVKGGQSAMRGHSISFYQDVQGFVDKLPRRPEDLPIIVIKAPNQKVDLKANRFHLMNALDFLKKNNPEYKDIVIDEEALGCYPTDSNTPIENIQTLEDTAMEPDPQPADSFPDDSTGVLDNQDVVMTAAPFEMPTRPMAEQIRERVLGQDSEAGIMNWPERGGAASEWEYGYFSKAFPNLFPTGRGDLTKPRVGKTPKLLHYIKHLTRLPDTQFAQDPRFLLHVTSMYRRHTALTLGNVFAKNVYRNMSMAELKEKVAQDDEAVIKSLVLFSAQIPGTKGYFSQEAKKAVALERWIRLKSGGEEMLNTFLTFSLPDQHLDDLHRLLPGSEQYLGKTVVDSMEDVPPDTDISGYIDKKTDYLLRSNAVSANGHIVDWYATKRINVLINTVLKTIGITDFVLRSEYQSRKAIHWHMAARTLGIHLDDIKSACQKYDFDVRCSTEEEQKMNLEEMTEYRLYLSSHGINPDVRSTDEQKAAVLESRDNVIEFTTKVLGLSAVHPQADPKRWPGPEGQDVSAPPTNVLRENFLQVTDMEEDYALLVNRAMLHACRRAYCLITTEARETICRFGFPLDLRGFIAMLAEVDNHQILDQIVRDEQFSKAAAFVLGSLELLRNHPRLVQHIPDILCIWRGNIDCKLIKSPESLLRYILKYIMKPETGSLAFNDIIKTLTANADDTTEPRKIFQKILLKTVGEHDISKNEAWRIVSGTS